MNTWPNQGASGSLCGELKKIAEPKNCQAMSV